MNQHLLRAAAINLDYGKKLVAEIPDEKMCVQPAPGMNHAAWVLGHLTFVADSMIKALDQTPGMSREWVELFNLSSKPTDERARYPSKAALLDAYEKAYARLSKPSTPKPPTKRWTANSPIRNCDRAAHRRRGDGPHPNLASRPAPGPAVGLA